MLTIILVFLCQFAHWSHAAADSGLVGADEAYLHRGQLMFHYELSRRVTFDRKPFHDVWIYKNGFVTLGLPLEEDHYPAMTDSSGLDQPFENMIGANIIAVFITTNEMRANSAVLVRQMPVKSQHFQRRKNLVKLEQKIRSIYERFLIEPLEHIFEVEWRNVAPFGVDKGKENSFHLFLLSNRAQTFCAIYYKNIQSTAYRNADKWLPYQSGIRSYSYMKFTMAPYDMTDRSIPADKSSNIGIKNTWLIMVGDSSYNMDIGWPMINMDANSLNPNKMYYQKGSKNKDTNSRFRNTWSTMKKIQTNNIKSTLKATKYRAKPLARRTSQKTTVVLSSTTSYRVTPRILGSGHLRERKLKKHAKIIRRTTTNSNLSERQILRKQNTIKNFKYKSSVDKSHNGSSSRRTSLPLRKNKLPELETSTRSSTANETNVVSIPEQDDAAYRTFQSIRKNKRYHQKRSSVNKPSNLKSIQQRTYSNDQEKPEMSVADPFSLTNSARSNGCSKELCKENEECFLSSNTTCCKCLQGAAYLDKRCIGNNSLFSVNSRGIVRIFSMGVQRRLDLSLVIAKRTQPEENFQRSHLTLVSDDDLSLEIRNFLLILYPLFHVPMSFYAFPWDNATVPNLSALVDEVAGIHIYLTVGSYKNIYISFKVERQGNNDKWTIAINGLDMDKVKALNLENRKLDEKSTGTYNLFYNLQNSNSIEYPEQTVAFYDEVNNTYLNIKWRGTMTFSSTCLSNYIVNKRFYVKFSDKRYCNSDCVLNHDINKMNCRVMCLSSPHVFDTNPDPCHGNFCGANKTCVNLGNQYECKCLEGFHEVGEHCLSGNPSTTTNSIITMTTKEMYGCSFCSENADCRISNYGECCICKAGFVGSGILCLEKDSKYELNSFGTIKISPSLSQPTLERSFNLRFRQWKRDEEVQYASLIEIDSFPYSTAIEKKILHSLLLLPPLFDVPSAIFAKNLLSHAAAENIYSMSRGMMIIRIKIESTILQPIEIIMKIYERKESFDTNVSIMGISAVTFDEKTLSAAPEHFNSRVMDNVSYRVKGNTITFDKHEIQLPKSIRGYRMWWQGTAELSSCTDINPEKSYSATTSAQSRCNTRCNLESCSPYCQTSRVLQLIPLDQSSTFTTPQHTSTDPQRKCLLICHSAASCVNGRCVCRPGFAGTGFICRAIRKTLECRNSKDCVHKPFTKCKNRRCVCGIKFSSETNNCKESEPCPSCGTNEDCVKGKCVCKSKFVRNRISQGCVFDCSLCDPYSTKCNNNGCICKEGFVRKNRVNTTCEIGCSSDTDCPTQEICSSSKTCFCPYSKENGLCQRKSNCGVCHRNALCQDDQCKCKDNWVGDGISCRFNCSLCLGNKFCNPEAGCICPNGRQAYENECTVKQCYGKCPNRSLCQHVQDQYKCICLPGLAMVGTECVHDTVQLTILPFGSTIDLVEGADLDLFCLGVSMATDFQLDWSRLSGMPIRGVKEFTDSSNRTLRLRLHSVTFADAGRYVCATTSGSQAAVQISVGKAIILCEQQCHQFANCENRMCICQKGYLGNGISCIPAKKCSGSCAEDEVCDWKTGQCVCHSGFVKSKRGCRKDCRKYDICDGKAQCNLSTGLCECMKEYIGNGTNCWKLENCLSTRGCVSNSTCVHLQELDYNLCICDNGFVGDGYILCHREIDCASHQCGPNSFCEPIIIKDVFGNLLRNGKCSCRPGYVLVDNVCQEQSKLQSTLWMSIGESLISLKLGEITKSSIRHIDLEGNNDTMGIITALAWGGCQQDRLIWSSQNGVNLKSAPIGNLSDTITHLSNLGKVSGISMDQETGNLFFTDSHKGRIGVININKNISRTLLELRDYTPGQILAHSRSGKLFWIVNDYQNPRIESADMTGENRHIFIALINQAISLVIVPYSSDTIDQLCWTEFNERTKKTRTTTSSSAKAVIRCTDTSRKEKLPTILTVHRIHNEEPFSGFAYFNKTFYWSVRSGAFIRSWGKQISRLDIRPNCCDSAVRGLTIRSEFCLEHYPQSNPCSPKSQTNQCPQLCIPRTSTIRQQIRVDPVCLSTDT